MTKRLLMHLAFIASVVSSPAFADKYNFYFAQSAEDSNSDGIPDSSAMNVKIINTTPTLSMTATLLHTMDLATRT